MNADYFQQANPERFTILGLRLKWLSLGRYQLMKRHGIAFVAEESVSAKPEDLILGVLICSQKVDAFNAWLELPAEERAMDLQKWRESICPQVWLCKLPIIGKRWLVSKIPDLLEKMRLFKQYVDAQQQIPKYWDESGQERTSAAHWSHAVEVTLRSQLGWTREEINEEPLGKALAHYFKYAESQGAIRLMTEAEVEQGEANARVLEQLMRN